MSCIYRDIQVLSTRSYILSLKETFEKTLLGIEP
jgi:hypothetical protein